MFDFVVNQSAVNNKELMLYGWSNMHGIFTSKMLHAGQFPMFVFVIRRLFFLKL